MTLTGKGRGCLSFQERASSVDFPIADEAMYSISRQPGVAGVEVSAAHHAKIAEKCIVSGFRLVSTTILFWVRYTHVWVPFTPVYVQWLKKLSQCLAVSER